MNISDTAISDYGRNPVNFAYDDNAYDSVIAIFGIFDFENTSSNTAVPWVGIGLYLLLRMDYKREYYVEIKKNRTRELVSKKYVYDEKNGIFHAFPFRPRLCPSIRI